MPDGTLRERVCPTLVGLLQILFFLFETYRSKKNCLSSSSVGEAFPKGIFYLLRGGV
jgi:hypothetical protein